MDIPYSITPGVWFLSWDSVLASADSIITYSYAFRRFEHAAELALVLTDMVRLALGGRWLLGYSSDARTFMSRVHEIRAERAFACPDGVECVSVKRGLDVGVHFASVRVVDQSTIGEVFSSITSPRQCLLYLSSMEDLREQIEALFSVPGKGDIGAMFRRGLGHAIVMFDGDDDYGWILHLVVPIDMPAPHSFAPRHTYVQVESKDLLSEASRVHRERKF